MRNGSVQISRRSNRVADSSEINYTYIGVYIYIYICSKYIYIMEHVVILSLPPPLSLFLSFSRAKNQVSRLYATCTSPYISNAIKGISWSCAARRDTCESTNIFSLSRARKPGSFSDRNVFSSAPNHIRIKKSIFLLVSTRHEASISRFVARRFQANRIKVILP